MIGRGLACGVALALVLGARSALAAESVTLDFSADADGGRAVLFGLAHRGMHWGWNLEAAHSAADATSDATDEAFSADGLAFGGSWSGETWSFGADYDRWSDNNGIDSTLLTARIAWQGETWRVAFMPRSGTVTALLPDPNALGMVQRDYDRSAVGLALEWRGGDWTWWAEGASWNYDPAIDTSTNAIVAELATLVDLQVLVALIRNGQTVLVNQYLAANGATELQQVLTNQGLAGLTRVVRFQIRRVQYATSLHTFALGLSDATARLGVERRIGDGAISLEYEQLEIPVDALQAHSLALRWRWPLTDALDVTASVGLIDTEDYGSATFAGLTFQWYID